MLCFEDQAFKKIDMEKEQHQVYYFSEFFFQLKWTYITECNNRLSTTVYFHTIKVYTNKSRIVLVSYNRNTTKIMKHSVELTLHEAV